MSNEPSKTASAAPEDWAVARPEKPPRPTLSPAALSLGATLIIWGFISSYLVTLFGVAVFVAALIVWIKEIRHERKS